ENTYTGTNGPATPVSANDIGLGPGANNNQPAPKILSAAVATGTLTIRFTVGVPNGTAVNVDIYQADSSSTPPARRFLGTGTVTTGAPPSSISINVPASVTNGSVIIATATVAANGTSPFSTAS